MLHGAGDTPICRDQQIGVHVNDLGRGKTVNLLWTSREKGLELAQRGLRCHDGRDWTNQDEDEHSCRDEYIYHHMLLPVSHFYR